LRKQDESPSNINADDIVPDPHLLIPPSQQEEEQEQRQLQQKDGVERSHSLSIFPLFGSTPPFIRQHQEHHDQQKSLIRRHSLVGEGSDDGFAIELEIIIKTIEEII